MTSMSSAGSASETLMLNRIVAFTNAGASGLSAPHENVVARRGSGWKEQAPMSGATAGSTVPVDASPRAGIATRRIAKRTASSSNLRMHARGGAPSLRSMRDRLLLQVPREDDPGGSVRG